MMARPTCASVYILPMGQLLLMNFQLETLSADCPISSSTDGELSLPHRNPRDNRTG
jgi:hypothetical protein